MIAIQEFDLDDVAKAKKALLRASLVTLVFSALNFTSTDFLLFGLGVRFNQPEAVKALQVLVAGILVVFTFRCVPAYAKQIGVYRLEYLEKLDEIEAINLQMDWGWDPTPELDPSPEGEFEGLSLAQKERRERTKILFERITFRSNTVSKFFLDIFFPLSLGLLAVFAPYSLDYWISASASEWLSPFSG